MQGTEYGKATKAADVVKHLCSKANYTYKWQLTGFASETEPVDWPTDSQKYDIYTNEEGMYEIVFSSQQPKTKELRRHFCKVSFPHFRQQLTNKMKEGHQQAIEERDAAIALPNDDLQKREYENVALQAQKDVYQAELQKCQDTITNLKTPYVPHAKNPGKDNIIIIVRKHTTSAKDKFHDPPYYVARIQQRKRYVKLRWLGQHFRDHEIIVEIDNPNRIHAFNRFEEEGHAEQKDNHFRLIELLREELYVMGVPAIFDDEEEKEKKKVFFSEKILLNFYDLNEIIKNLYLLH